jgi:uncharacterized protein
MTNELKNWLESNEFDSADIEKIGENDSTALLITARKGLEALTLELLALGTNVNHKNKDGNNALWNATYAKSAPIVTALINTGIDKNNQNDNGATALMYAASNALEEMVELLLALDCDKNIENHDDYTALNLASTAKILKMLK